MNMNEQKVQSFYEKYKEQIKIALISLAIVILLLVIASFFGGGKNKEDIAKNIKDNANAVVGTIEDTAGNIKDKVEGKIDELKQSFNEEKTVVDNNIVQTISFAIPIVIGALAIYKSEMVLNKGSLPSKENWFIFRPLLLSLLIIAFFEFVIHYFLIGTIRHFLSKNKDKKYLNSLKINALKRFYLKSKMSLIITLISVIVGIAVVIVITCKIFRAMVYLPV